MLARGFSGYRRSTINYHETYLGTSLLRFQFEAAEIEVQGTTSTFITEDTLT